MRAEENPLDLNNFPDDYTTRDGKQATVDEDNSSSTGCRRKRNGGKDGKDECGKVYECRFCSLKFCKSQALGGHMNRHRQERETETLNRARQLVYSSDSPAVHGAAHHPHLGCHPMAPAGSYHHPTRNNTNNMAGDPFRSMYSQPRLFPGGSSSSSSTLLSPPPPPPPHHPPYLYSSPSRHHLPPYNHQQPLNDFYIGHVLNYHHHHPNYTSPLAAASSESNYTCIGAPVVGLGGFGPATGGATRGADGAGRDGPSSLGSSLQLDQEGLSWGSRSYTNTAAGSI